MIPIDMILRNHHVLLMTKRVALASVVLLLVQQRCPAQHPTSLITFYWPSSSSLVGALSVIKVQLDDTLVLKMRSGRWTKLVVAPGPHRVSTRNSDIELSVGPDLTSYVRIFHETGLILGKSLALEVVPASARTELERCKPMEE